MYVAEKKQSVKVTSKCLSLASASTIIKADVFTVYSQVFSRVLTRQGGQTCL